MTVNKKKLLIVGLVLVIILGGYIFFFQNLQYSIWGIPYGSIQERNDFNTSEIALIEKKLNFELGDEAKIVNSRCIASRDSALLLWIDGITDKEDFCTKNSLHFFDDDLFDIGGNGEERNVEQYDATTAYAMSVRWNFYKNGDTWSAYVESSDVDADIEKIFWGIRYRFKE